jgi:hypothetical protein
MNEKAKQYVVLEHLTLPDRGFRFITTNCYYSGSHDNNTHGYNGEEWYKEVGFTDTIEEAQAIVRIPGAPTATWDELYEYHKENIKKENQKLTITKNENYVRNYFKRNVSCSWINFLWNYVFNRKRN